MKINTGQKRLCCFIALLLLLLPILLLPASAGAYVSLDTSPVEKDLETLIGKEALSQLILDETVKADDGAQFLSVVYLLEHGYDCSLTDWSHYGLYLYIYNPSGKSLASTTKNCVEMQVDLLGGGRTEVVKYPLKLVSFSDNRVLYKYKITGIPTGILAQMKVSERGYHISGMEFQFYGMRNPKDYDVSMSYIFTGFNAGFDSTRSVNDTLRSRYEQLETVSVELHPTSWMSATSDKGEGYKYEVSGVYFAIPNYYLKTYGNWDGDEEMRGLYAVSGTFREGRINGIVTDNKEVYSAAQEVAGKSIKWYGYNPRKDLSRESVTYREDFPLSFLFGVEKLAPFQAYYVCSYNIQFRSNEHSSRKIDRICIPFYSATDEAISADTVKEALAEYAEDYRNTDVDEGRIYGSQKYTVTADDTPMGFTKLDYSQEHPYWAWWHRFTSKTYGDEQAEVEWLQRIDLSFLDSIGATETKEIADTYYIGEADVSGLRKLCNSNAVQNGVLNGISGSSVYLMHFAKTDYYSTAIDCFESTVIEKEYDGNHYYYERTVFEDFDILEFTFKRENGELTAVPVVASPVTVTGGLPAPSDPDGNPSNPGTKDPGPTAVLGGCAKTYDSLNGWGKLIAILLGVVLLALLFTPLAKLLSPLFGFVGKGIGAVFRGIGSLFRGGANAVKGAFNAKETVYDSKRKRKEDRQHDEDRAENAIDRQRKRTNELDDRATAAADRQRKQKYEDEDRETAKEERLWKHNLETYDREVAEKDRKRRQAREDVEQAHRDALHAEELHHKRFITTNQKDNLKERGRSLDRSTEKDKD